MVMKPSLTFRVYVLSIFVFLGILWLQRVLSGKWMLLRYSSSTCQMREKQVGILCLSEPVGIPRDLGSLVKACFP